MVQRRYDIIAITFVAICLASYASIRSEFRLRQDMPVEFFDPSHVPPGKRTSEEKVARAYWNCAVTQIQWKYGYAHRLPEDPPDDFTLTTEQAGSAAKDPALRERYWQKLRALWGVSTMWERRYEWNTDTLRNSLQSAGQWLEELGRRILG